MKRQHRALIGSLLFSALLAAPAWAQQATARFSPDRIYPDETTIYQVTLDGVNSMGNAEPPSVAGLQVLSRSQNSSVQYINGNMSASVTLSFGMQAEKAGTYTIPSFEVGSVEVPAATLTVLPMTAARQQELEAREQQQRDAQREILGMELTLPESPCYVGQAIPIRLTMYIRGDLYADPLNRPIKDGDAFTLTEFTERPTERIQMRNGRRYREYIWENILTPLKAGNFDLSFKEAFVVGRSFFNQQQVELSTDPQKVDVLALPREGKPADFDGAVGKFTIERPDLDTNSLRVGEPLTMRVKVSGEGNFDRMGPPALRDTDGWRVYPPEDSFQKDDPFGYRGVKTYEFVIIPKSESVTQTPGVAFSFFEPEAKEYVELTPEPLPVEVLPAPPGSRPIIEPRRSAGQPRGPSLLPNMAELGATTAHIRPIFFNQLFLAGQVIPLAAILGLFFWRKHQLRLETDTDFARRRRARREVARQLQAASQAAQGDKPEDFYTAARRAVQEAVAPDLQREPESLTLHEVEAYLIGTGAKEDALVAVRNCFEAGDALRFGGLSAASVSMPAELAQIKALIAHVEGGRK